MRIKISPRQGEKICSSRRNAQEEHPSWSQRIVSLFVGLIFLGILLLAGWLQPDPQGYGTHQELDLPACGFLERTGYPCPTCGMTTAFACMVRGRVLCSFAAQPAGALGALICMATVVICFYITLGGRFSSKIIKWCKYHSLHFVYLALATVLLAWGWRCLWTYWNSRGI